MRRRPLAAVLLAVAVMLASAATTEAKVRDLTFRWGPVVVAPYEGMRGGTPVRAPRMDGSLVEMDAVVVDKRNHVIPQNRVMLHHLVVKDLGHSTNVKRDAACPGRGGDQRFYGESEELRALTLPEGYGYSLDRQDRWRMGWMLMNHTHTPRTAWIRYHVKVDTRRLRPVTPYWFSVMGCHVDPQFTVPGGGRNDRATYRRGRAFTVPHDGRIVAVGGHLHGGGRGISLTQPHCGNRALVNSKPTYGMPDDPLYQVRPLLHEPDARNISWWQSRTGVPVKRGESLRVVARYRSDFPYMRVMGIDHVYIAHGSAPGACRKLPDDAQELGPAFVGRAAPSHMELTLATIGADGYAHPTDGPQGRTRSFTTATVGVTERRYAFRPSRLSIPAGSRVRWTFRDEDLHDATLANGPRGFSSPPMWGGAYSHRFSLPGTYRIYCSLHPVTMQQVVTVRATR